MLVMRALAEMSIKTPAQAQLIIDLLGKLNEDVFNKNASLALIKR